MDNVQYAMCSSRTVGTGKMDSRSREHSSNLSIEVGTDRFNPRMIYQGSISPVFLRQSGWIGICGNRSGSKKRMY